MVALIVLLGIIKGGKIPPMITELNTYIIFVICLFLVTL